MYYPCRSDGYFTLYPRSEPAVIMCAQKSRLPLAGMLAFFGMQLFYDGLVET
jgi:hypothetical protein